jgi:transcription-repair coupling factor (superfamily II helicase)
LDQFALQLKDRFGELPPQVWDLIEMIKLRELAKQLGFEKIVMKNSGFAAYFPDEKKQA